jgi:Transposase
LDSALPSDEAKLRALIGKLKEHGSILLVVDQPATVGALPNAVARAEGALVAYLPRLAMRRIADMLERPRPMRGTPTSSLRQPVAYRIRFAR